MTTADKAIALLSLLGILGMALALSLGLSALARADALLISGFSYSALAFAQAGRMLCRVGAKSD